MISKREWAFLAGVFLCLCLGAFVAFGDVNTAKKDNMAKVIDDPEIQGLYQACGNEKDCKIVSRNVKLLEAKDVWVYEPIIFVRTASVIDPTVARFKSAKGTGYIVLLIPSGVVDAALIKLLEGK